MNVGTPQRGIRCGEGGKGDACLRGLLFWRGGKMLTVEVEEVFFHGNSI